MDKIKTYQRAILAVLKKHQFIATINDNDTLRDEIITDVKQHHYQLVTLGWKNDHYFFNILFHLHIANDKIWLQQNNTDWRIADELIAEGILKNDIVLGFIDPLLRQYSDFAVA